MSIANVRVLAYYDFRFDHSLRKVPHFSLVIIGSGSGNVVVPKDPAQGPVALIESGTFGGT